VSADALRSALGIGGPEPEVRAPKLTPAQQRAKDEGKPVPPAPADFETTVIEGGRAAWEYLGKPALEAPPGSPDGTPVPVEPPPRSEPQRTDWAKIDGEQAEPQPRAPTPNEAAEELRQMAREHVRRQMVRTEEVRRSGTPEQKKAAAEEAERTVSLVNRIRERLGGAL